MSKSSEQQDRRLVGLAQRIDHGDEAFERVEESYDLQKQDLDKIDRVKSALEFLATVKTDLAETDCAETARLFETESGRPSIQKQLDGHASTDTLPQTISRFQIKRLIGQGGFAKVFLAFDPQLHRHVALKVLSAAQAFSGESAARFEREARAAATLSHPNVIPVFDFGRVDSDCYIISEYCDGISLQEWFQNQNRQLDSRMAALIAATIADAVAHAHQRGVVHRDLKPGNIMLALKESEQFGKTDPAVICNRLQITDFGLAKHTEVTDSLKTRDGAIVGTPAYMSPEQAAASQSISESTDIYSIGVMLYEMLTGELPIIRETHIDTLIAVKRDDPKPVRQLKRSVSQDLEAICMKCLCKSPTDRYASAFDLAADLRRWVNGEPVRARRQGVTDRAIKWCRRNPEIAIATTLVSLGLIFSLFQWNKASRSAESEKVAAAKSERSARLSQETVRQLVNDVAMSSRIEPEFSRDLVQKAVDLQTQLLAENPEDSAIRMETARVWNQLSVSEFEMRQFDDAMNSSDTGLSVLDIVPAGERDDKFTMLRNQLLLHKARIYNETGKGKKALETIEATEIDDSNLFQSSDRFIESGKAELAHQNWQAAWNEFEKGLIVMHNLPKRSDPIGEIVVRGDIALLLYLQGTAEFYLDRWEDAKANLERSMLLHDEVMALMPYHASMVETRAMAQSQLGYVQAKLGDFDHAIDNLREAIDGFHELHENNLKMDRYRSKWYRTKIYLTETYLLANSFDDAQTALAQLDELFDSIPARPRETREFAGSLAQFHGKLAEHFKVESDEKMAKRHLQSVKRYDEIAVK